MVSLMLWICNYLEVNVVFRGRRSSSATRSGSCAAARSRCLFDLFRSWLRIKLDVHFRRGGGRRFAMPLMFQVVFQGSVEMDVAFGRWRGRTRLLLVLPLPFLNGLNNLFRDGDPACSRIFYFLVVFCHLQSCSCC